MPSLRGSVTERNLKDALAWEKQTNHRYLHFAQKAHVEGFNDVTALFRSIAESKTRHANGPRVTRIIGWFLRRTSRRLSGHGRRCSPGRLR